MASKACTISLKYYPFNKWKVIFGLFLSILIYDSQSSAQKPSPSLRKEVFDFSVGDTFAYHEEQEQYNLAINSIKAVIEKKVLSDSFLYKLHVVERIKLGNNYSYRDYIDSTIYTKLDSSIFFNIKHNCDSSIKKCRDTSWVSAVNQYGGVNKNHYDWISSESSYSIDFAPQLGILNEENSASTNGYINTRLVYYNKINGEKWGDKPILLSVDLIDKRQINIFPNPVQNELNIQLESNFNQDILISVFNLLGQEIYKQKGTLTFNCSNLMPGIYFLHVIVDRTTYVYTFHKI